MTRCTLRVTGRHHDRERAVATALEALADEVSGEDFAVSDIDQRWNEHSGSWIVDARALWFV